MLCPFTRGECPGECALFIGFESRVGHVEGCAPTAIAAALLLQDDWEER